MKKKSETGFTLIELSIVLVIIGLIVGGILVGQDLIKAAEVRAQISQIEKYNSAVNTFRGKFGAIPGDMPIVTANQFGFTVGTSCTGTQGQRDGNGLLDGWSGAFWLDQGVGEVALFWQDISSPVAGNLIEGSFPNGGVTYGCVVFGSDVTGTAIGQYLPAAKIGHGNYIYVYENGGPNWFGIAAVTKIQGASNILFTNADIPVIQTYNMDKKVDDGLPTTGTVQATFINANNGQLYTAGAGATDSSTTCYNTTTNAYSINSLASYGTNGNCALSFRFQ